MEKDKKKQYKLISYLCAIAFCTLAYWILGKVFNFYYELNDDVLIKDILSGIYTGTPEGHNNQMLYPISWLLKSLYSINPTIAWMGIMEIGLMWLCSILILARTQYLIMSHIEGVHGKLVASVGMYVCVTVFGVGVNLWEMIMVQYTVVSGMLATTAAYLVLTDEEFEINENIPAIVLVTLAFNIRSEMLLLMSPFIATVGICKWISDGLNWKECKKYIGFLAIILCALGVSFTLDKVAYKSQDWQEFRDVFDARTNLYDFTGIPDYDTNQEFYEGQMASKYDYDRLQDYNFVLSDRINAQLLMVLSEYAAEHNTKEKTLPYAVFEMVQSMAAWKTPKGRDALTDSTLAFYEDGNKLHVPFNQIILILYILAIIAAAYARDVKWAYTLPILLVMRTISWGFAFYKGRINLRIAHPMYFAEMVILVGVLLVAWAESDYRSAKTKKRICALLVIAFLTSMLINALYIPSSVRDVKNKSALREQYNKEAKALYEYTSTNVRDYYLIDVYSTVSYTERIFDNTIKGKGNTQLAGGWIALSPLDDYKQGFYSEDFKFITANMIEGVQVLDDIRCDDIEGTLFFVYNASDVKNALKSTKTIGD